ncbi:hypothetical protein D3C78_1201930 [compost metagenome]
MAVGALLQQGLGILAAHEVVDAIQPADDALAHYRHAANDLAQILRRAGYAAGKEIASITQKARLLVAGLPFIQGLVLRPWSRFIGVHLARWLRLKFGPRTDLAGLSRLVLVWHRCLPTMI